MTMHRRPVSPGASGRGRSEVVSQRDERLIVVVRRGSRGDRAVDPLVFAGPVEDSSRGGAVGRLEVDDDGDGAVLEREAGPNVGSLLLRVEVAGEAVVADNAARVPVDAGAGKGIFAQGVAGDVA